MSDDRLSSKYDELAQNLVLEDLRYRELHAVAVKIDAPSGRPEFKLGVTVHDKDENNEDTPRSIQISLRVSIEVSDGTITVEPEAMYSIAEDKAYLAEPDAVLEFFNRNAISTLLPYARQALSDLSQRALHSQILMPILGPGDLIFDKSTAHREGDPGV